MASPAADYDSPWKEALEQYFQPFLALCASALHDATDWRHPPQFLNKELQALVHDADAGRRYADLLVRVRGIDGQPALILIHVEVQSDGAGQAARMRLGARMYQYHHRISDRYLPGGVLADDKPISDSGLPGHNTAPGIDGAPGYGTALFSLGILTQSKGGSPFLDYNCHYLGSGVHFRCPVVHLAKWNKQWDELERLTATNPFAVVIMAQLRAQASRDGKTRLASKTAITRLLYRYRYSRKDVWQLFRLIDWMIALPPELEPAYRHELDLIEQEHKMTYVTSIERLGREDGLKAGLQQGLQEGRQEGRQKGRQEGLRKGLKTGQLQGSATVLRTQIQSKFGPLPPSTDDRITTADAPTLQRWALNVLDARTIDDVFD